MFNLIPGVSHSYNSNSNLQAVLMWSYAQTNNLKAKAIDVYKFMLERNNLPNKFTYPFVLKACAGIGDLNLGKSVHGSVVKFGFGDEVNVQNTLVHMYCCCRGGEGGVEFARKVFDEMSKSDSVSWSAMIGGYVRVGRSSDAISLFREMQIKGVCPDEITMVSVLSACTGLGALELGKWVESYVEKESVQKNMVAYTVGGTYGLQHQDENAAGMSSSFCSHVSAFFSL
ncbi:hypothetical protein SADUNF_Sadunf06G0202900 [Salix dunnii]|uniref:Pentatricopeptide repeat-containing protein n=1 Tax=Salix dunnii TaxID=1413687 RepID=A0A835K5T5_9ROSI|nr:hypothetical protein SADUNF_Sadunf06G0202900 [Salix dunnii]